MRGSPAQPLTAGASTGRAAGNSVCWQIPAQQNIKGDIWVEVIKLESGSGVILKINGNTIFTSDNTSYWLQDNKLMRDDGVCQRGVADIKEALTIVLLKYGGIKGRETETTRILEHMFAADGVRIQALGFVAKTCDSHTMRNNK